MKAPKILAVASAVDLDFRYGCTPAWWQLWKGMYEAGVDLVVTPYRGRPVESPWWRTAPNPTYHVGESYAALRDGLARLKGDRYLRRAEASPAESGLDRLTRETVWRVVTPRWRRHLERLVERERPDAVVVFTVPMAHLLGIPTALRERFGIPVVFYDGDVPMSLPEFGGMDTGFNYYHGADPSEYDLVLSNSEGGLPRLLELGARRAEAVLLGRGSRVLRAPAGREGDGCLLLRLRRQVPAGMDGRDDRRAEPGGPRDRLRPRRQGLPRRHGGGATDRRRSLQRVRPGHLGGEDQPERDAALACDGARILDVPALRAGGSRCRDRLQPACRDRAWFEPGSEIVVVRNAGEALAAYRELLDDPAQAEAMGARARERVLAEHTYAHRARRVLELLGLGVASAAVA